jgi:acyl-CoA reductase-like NAD-dependent aldehyde dehydrogenase
MQGLMTTNVINLVRAAGEAAEADNLDAFDEAAEALIQALRDQLVGTHDDLQALIILEANLAVDRDFGDEYPATVRAIRERIEWLRHLKASPN